MKTLLICHHDAPLTRLAMERWLASFSELSGVLVIRETKKRMRRRIRTEIRRVGLMRFLVDVLPFRVYSRLFLASRDAEWERGRIAEVEAQYPPVSEDTPVLEVRSPNVKRAKRFISECAPDIMIARCKSLLRESVFSIPASGTFVMHPGICPEYRNAHGCFWALANDELDKVGMTLLRIDRGVDTGPIFGYFSYDFDEVRESPNVIHQRVVLDNLDALRETLLRIHSGEARPIETTGRGSATWGQPWLSRYLAWKRRARKRAR